MGSIGTIVFPIGAGGNHVRWLLFLDKKFPGGSTQEKLEYIENKIYHKNKSWNTWITDEWQFRPLLDPYVLLTHDPVTVANKKLFLVCEDPILPCDHYFHINLGLLNMTRQTFIDQISGWNKRYKTQILSKDKKTINCDPLFEPTLSENFYAELVEFFELDNHYEDACKVHLLYNQCKIKSSRDFYQYFTGEEFKNFLDSLKNKFEGKN